MLRARFLVVGVSLLAAVGLAATPAQASVRTGAAPTAPYNALTVEYVTGTTSSSRYDQAFDASNSTIVFVPNGALDEFLVDPTNSSSAWYVNVAPPSGSSLTTGTFATASSYTGSSWFFSIGECTSSGTITISQVTQDPTSHAVTSIALDYSLQCTTGGSSYEGSLRYNSTVGYAAASTSPNTGDDGSQYVGTTLTHPVTVTNLGTSALTLGTTAFTTATPTAYAMTSDSCSGATLQPGDTCQASVALDVTTQSTLTAQLVFATAPTLPDIAVSFTVTGLPSPVVTATPGPGNINLAWTQLAGVGDFLDFEIYRGTSPTALGMYATAQYQGYDDQQVSPGVTYYYSIAQVTRDGTGPLTSPVAMETWPAGGAGSYQSQAPERILDTRTTVGGHHGPLGPGQSLVVEPFGVLTNLHQAVVINLTVTGATQSTYLTAYAYGQSRPAVSSINVQPGQDRANLVTVPLSPGGRFVIYNNAGYVNVVADLSGSYQSAAAPAYSYPSPGLYHPYEEPGRVFDTRKSQYGPLPGGYYQLLKLNGFSTTDMPHVTAVALNITAVGSSGRGYLTVWNPAQGTQPPTSSVVNFAGPGAVANMTIVQTTAQQTGSGLAPPEIAVYNGSTAAVQYIVDIVGFFDDDYLPYGARYVPTTPTRLVDTRRGVGIPRALGPGVTKAVDPGSLADYWTFALDTNTTAVLPTNATYLTMWPDGISGVGRPITSNLNAGPGQTVANHAMISVGNNNVFDVYNNAGTTNVLVDVVGRFDSYPFLQPTGSPSVTENWAASTNSQAPQWQASAALAATR